jgi:EAL domain-containing protein (putative c-di-GMP-specific phosphodiesterase class I)
MIDRRNKTKAAVLDFSRLEDTSGAADSGQATWSLTRRSATGSEEHRATLSSDRMRIGRRPDNDLCVNHPTVSGYHAELFMVGDDLLIKDLNSTNGTLLNGSRLQSVAGLNDGDAVHIGQVMFSVEKIVQRSSNPGEFGNQTFVAAVPEDAVLHQGFDQLLNRPDVYPHFQPIVCLQDKSLCGYEMLVRSQIDGLETPDKIFRVAAMRMSEARLSEMCRSEGLLAARNLNPEVSYFLNTHPVELGTSELLRSLERLRNSYPEMSIVLEVHEGAITSISYLKDLVAHLQDLQIKLAYDDFGAGQARLIELFQVPPDYLKFDLNFVRGLSTAPEHQRSSVRSLLRVVKELNVRALAEGIETPDQAELCQDLGFELAQGYYFGRPQPCSYWLETLKLPDVTQSLPAIQDSQIMSAEQLEAVTRALKSSE